MKSELGKLKSQSVIGRQATKLVGIGMALRCRSIVLIAMAGGFRGALRDDLRNDLDTRISPARGLRSK